MADRFAVWHEITALDAAARNINNPKLIHKLRLQNPLRHYIFRVT
jgi:hypothetical protein